MIETALFGAGRIGRIHAANLAAHPAARLKYVVDVNESAARELASLHGARPASPDEAFADPAVKAAVIASSTDTHAALIVRAARAGDEAALSLLGFAP